jgi:tetratricopeptide (TPR) repeat protein
VADAGAEGAAAVAEFGEKLIEFREEVEKLPPERAAERWLELLDDAAKLPPRPKSSRNVDGFYDPDDPRNLYSTASVFAELPPTADWDALAQALDARAGASQELRPLTLRVLAATLRGDIAAKKEGPEAMRKALAAATLSGDARAACSGDVERLNKAIVKLSGNTDQAAPAKRLEAETAQGGSRGTNSRRSDDLSLPDLAPLAGPKKTKTLAEEVARVGSVRPARDYLRDALAKDPMLPYWLDYLHLSTRLGEVESVLELLRATALRSDLSLTAREEVQECTLEALLAADHVEEGLSLLRAIIQNGPSPGKWTARDEAEQQQVVMESMGFARVTLPPAPRLRAGFAKAGRKRTGLLVHVRRCLQLAWLGHLLGKPATLKEGLDDAMAAMRKAELSDPEYRLALEGLARLLANFGRGPEAERLVWEDMAYAAGRKPEMLPDLVQKLAVIDYLMGRHEEALKLMDTSPDWASPHLAFYRQAKSLFVPVLLVAGQALADAGKKQTQLDQMYDLRVRFVSHPLLAPLADLLDHLPTGN